MLRRRLRHGTGGAAVDRNRPEKDSHEKHKKAQKS